MQEMLNPIAIPIPNWETVFARQMSPIFFEWQPTELHSVAPDFFSLMRSVEAKNSKMNRLLVANVLNRKSSFKKRECFTEINREHHCINKI